jgi:hypothetical protein
MATVSSFRFDFLSNPIWQPGDVHGIRIGPWSFLNGKSLSFTAWPFDLSTATRAIEVVSVQTVTRPWPDIGPPFVPIPDHHVVFVDVKNVGPDPIVIWTLFMGVMAP